MSPLNLSFLIATGLATVAGTDLGIPFALGYASRKLLRRRARKARAVVLTFDDGPGSRLTPAILRILAERKVKATFFLLGQKVGECQEVVRQIQEQGHEICSHGYSHNHMWRTGFWRAIQDIKRGRVAIDAVLGDHDGERPFRPPYGKLDLITLIYLWLTGVTVHYWTIDSTDTWMAATADWSRAPNVIHRNGGGVILVHDFDRNSPDLEQAILDSINKVLDVARQDNLRVMTLSDLMRDGDKG
jgi:peptidoglycan/xylan/chitin deacetylase (PgdA/CDA1 family)